MPAKLKDFFDERIVRSIAGDLVRAWPSLDERRFVREGLDGLETHHRTFGPETRAAMSATASRLGLVETGGTDYHGDLGPYAGSHGGLVMPEDLVVALGAVLRELGWPVRP